MDAVDLMAIAQVSIHAPVKGATAPPCAMSSFACSFNPRPREGGDPEYWLTADKTDGVSIHAPVKGATLSVMCGLGDVYWFQSTPP